MALELKIREMENAYLASALPAKNYLDEAARHFEKFDSTPDDEVASDDGFSDPEPGDVASDMSDWEDLDEDWFAIATREG